MKLKSLATGVIHTGMVYTADEYTDSHPAFDHARSLDRGQTILCVNYRNGIKPWRIIMPEAATQFILLHSSYGNKELLWEAGYRMIGLSQPPRPRQIKFQPAHVVERPYTFLVD